MPEVVMPRLSDSMEEGTILKWLKGDGEEVARGEELVEIETDKATMTYEADQAGELHIVAAEGDTLPIGAVIARIGAGGNGTAEQAASAPEAGAAGAAANGETAVAPPASASAPAAASAAASPPAPAPAAAPAAAPASPAAGDDGARVKASPLARRIARELGVALATLRGSGPGGRIVKADVEAAAVAGPAPAIAGGPAAAVQPEDSAPAAAPPGAPLPGAAPALAAPAPSLAPGEAGTAKGDVFFQEPTRGQQVVARRMAESKATIPEFTLQAEVDMEECVALRAQLKELAGAGGVVPTYNDMIVKACAIALREHPRANGSYRDGRFELHSRVNVGVAVAADGQAPGQDTLVVPTVFDADVKSLSAIAADTRRLAERVRAGAVTPPELSGGTFTVSNLGMFSITSFTAVINPPQAAILAVGSLAERAVVRSGQIVPRHTMSITLSCDHRILYGAGAAKFLSRIRELLERPLALAL